MKPNDIKLISYRHFWRNLFVFILQFLYCNSFSQNISINESGLYINGKKITYKTSIPDIQLLFDKQPRNIVSKEDSVYKLIYDDYGMRFSGNYNSISSISIERFDIKLRKKKLHIKSKDLENTPVNKYNGTITILKKEYSLDNLVNDSLRTGYSNVFYIQYSGGFKMELSERSLIIYIGRAPKFSTKEKAESYLKEYPNGDYAEEASRSMSEFNKKDSINLVALNETTTYNEFILRLSRDFHKTISGLEYTKDSALFVLAEKVYFNDIISSGYLFNYNDYLDTYYKDKKLSGKEYYYPHIEEIGYRKAIIERALSKFAAYLLLFPNSIHYSEIEKKLFAGIDSCKSIKELQSIITYAPNSKVKEIANKRIQNLRPYLIKSTSNFYFKVTVQLWKEIDFYDSYYKQFPKPIERKEGDPIIAVPMNSIHGEIINIEKFDQNDSHQPLREFWIREKNLGNEEIFYKYFPFEGKYIGQGAEIDYAKNKFSFSTIYYPESIVTGKIPLHIIISDGRYEFEPIEIRLTDVPKHEATDYESIHYPEK